MLAGKENADWSELLEIPLNLYVNFFPSLFCLVFFPPKNVLLTWPLDCKQSLFSNSFLFQAVLPTHKDGKMCVYLHVNISVYIQTATKLFPSLRSNMLQLHFVLKQFK